MGVVPHRPRTIKDREIGARWPPQMAPEIRGLRACLHARFPIEEMRGITQLVMLYRSAVEALMATQGSDLRETADEDTVRRRQREETEPRAHAYLSQTVPPDDPVVRAIERRRSGCDPNGE